MSIKTFLLLLILIPHIGVATSDHKWEFTEIHGNTIAWSCEGEGRPTVLLIAGSGLDAHGSFGRIYHGYEGPGKICFYDRAGMGLSTFENPAPKTLDEMANELSALIAHHKWKELVLVPHSFGGMIARKYAALNPEGVRGILFVDSNHEDWLGMMQGQVVDSDWAIMERIMDWNVRTFYEDIREAERSVRKATIDDQTPITLISRGVPHTQIRLEKMTYAGIRAYEATFIETQKRILHLSEDSRHVIAEASSHMINDYDPWLVIEEIELLVKRAMSE